MKDWEHNTSQQFKQLIESSSASKAPEVNVRAGVMAALTRQARSKSPVDASLQELTEVFSGLKAGIFAGIVMTMVAISSIYAASEFGDTVTIDSETDEVVEFMDDGDWSEFL